MNRLERKENSHDWWKPVLLLVIIITLFILARTFGLGERLGDLREWIKGLGFLGPIVFVLLYIGATVAAIPGSAITIAAGAIFGSLIGVICVSIASTLGASLCFLISRYFARDAINKWLSRSKKFQKLDQLTEKHGAVIVALTRLVPIFPFNLLNYGFGLTRVPFWTYFFWSWLCMLPGTVLYVVGAAALTEGLAEGRVPWLLIVILIGIAVILTLLVRYARRMLQNKEKNTL